MMPGVNCSVLDCGSCRRLKGIGIFKLPVAKGSSKMAHRLARRGNESTRNRPGFMGADQKRQSARLRETFPTRGY